MAVPQQLRQDYNLLLEEHTSLQEDHSGLKDHILQKTAILTQCQRENAELKQQLLKLEKASDAAHKENQEALVGRQGEWEHSLHELQRELEQTKGELTQKEISFCRVSKDLQQKLQEIDSTREQKSKLMRRVEDFESELQTLRSQKDTKDSKL